MLTRNGLSSKTEPVSRDQILKLCVNGDTGRGNQILRRRRGGKKEGKPITSRPLNSKDRESNFRRPTQHLPQKVPNLVSMYGHTYSKSMINPVITGNMNIFLSAFGPENLVSRNGFGSPVPRQPAHLHITGFLPSSAAASIYSFITAIPCTTII